MVAQLGRQCPWDLSPSGAGMGCWAGQAALGQAPVWGRQPARHQVAPRPSSSAVSGQRGRAPGQAHGWEPGCRVELGLGARPHPSSGMLGWARLRGTGPGATQPDGVERNCSRDSVKPPGLGQSRGEAGVGQEAGTQRQVGSGVRVWGLFGGHTVRVGYRAPAPCWGSSAVRWLWGGSGCWVRWGSGPSVRLGELEAWCQGPFAGVGRGLGCSVGWGPSPWVT